MSTETERMERTHVPCPTPAGGAEHEALTTDEQRTSRRGMLGSALRAAAVGAAGLAGASALLETRAGLALASSTLVEDATGSGNVAIEADGTSGADGILATSDTGRAINATNASSSFSTIDARNTGGNNAIFASATNGGTGVAAYSDTASALYGQSATGSALSVVSASGYGGSFQGGLAPIALIPARTTGHPAAGAHRMGELYVHVAGVLWFCTANGAPGTWKRVSLH
jgi:hypothetical protein